MQASKLCLRIILFTYFSALWTTNDGEHLRVGGGWKACVPILSRSLRIHWHCARNRLQRYCGQNVYLENNRLLLNSNRLLLNSLFTLRQINFAHALGFRESLPPDIPDSDNRPGATRGPHWGLDPIPHTPL